MIEKVKTEVDILFLVFTMKKIFLINFAEIEPFSIFEPKVVCLRRF